MTGSEDQDQESEGTEPSGEARGTQGTQPTGQSDDQKGGEQETEGLFELPDGRKVDSKTLAKEWKENFYPEFTRRSQRLKAFEKAEEEAKSRAGQAARDAVAKDDLLKDVDPAVQAAIGKIAEPIIQKAIDGLKGETAQQEKDRAFEVELVALEKEIPGGDGRPKFDRSKVIAEMRKPDNRDFDPRTVYEKLNRKELLDYSIKQSLKKQKGGSQLETTGTEDGQKPQAKSPKTWGEAAKAARSRI